MQFNIINLLLFQRCLASLPAFSREISSTDRERTEECNVHDTEEYREQSRQRNWLEGTANERRF